MKEEIVEEETVGKGSKDPSGPVEELPSLSISDKVFGWFGELFN